MSIRELKKEKFNTVVISKGHDEFFREEVNIIYDNKRRIALSAEEFILIDEKNNIIYRDKFSIANPEYLSIINHELVRATHDVTLKVFGYKTDCKESTIHDLLKNVESEYLKSLLMMLAYIHNILNLQNGDVATYLIDVN